MPLSSLDHCSIRTVRLEESRKFYVDVLGMTEGERLALTLYGEIIYAITVNPGANVDRLGRECLALLGEIRIHKRIEDCLAVARLVRGRINGEI